MKHRFFNFIILSFIFFIPSFGEAQIPPTFQVNLAADAADALPGDVLCDIDLNVQGEQCTLRAALQEANALGGAFILLPGGDPYVLSIPNLNGMGEDDAATGDLDINVSTAPNEMRIIGDGPVATIIDGGGLDRVFDIDPKKVGVIVEIEGVTIQNGQPPREVECGMICPPPISRGGGIRNHGHLVLRDSRLTVNEADWGGGIWSDIGSTLEIFQGLIDRNTGDGVGSGGAIRIGGSTLEENSGFGVSHVGTDPLTVTDSAIRKNFGGISNNNTGALTVIRSTISGNTDRGGISNVGNATIVNTTISGNVSAFIGEAGGINSTLADSTLNLIHVTITRNTGDSTQFPGTSAGGLVVTGGTVNLKNTILAGNVDLNLQGTPDCVAPNNTGAIQSLGYNLLGNNKDCPFLASLTDQVGTETDPIDPGLGLLADNGGLTETHALPQGSKTLDVIPLENCTDDQNNPVTIDQRGISRPQNAACDIGAYEATLVPQILPNPPTVPSPPLPPGNTFPSGTGAGAPPFAASGSGCGAQLVEGSMGHPGSLVSLLLALIFLRLKTQNKKIISTKTHFKKWRGIFENHFY